MLSCLCSVIDHRWHQNAVKTKRGTRGYSRVCHWCSFPLTFWRLLDARQHGIYLFYTIKKQTTSTDDRKALSFNMTWNPGLWPLWKTRKQQFDAMSCVCKMKRCYWLLCRRNRELWLVQGNHATVKLEPGQSSVACPGIENLQRK